jgi:hypothetical protein
LSTALKAVAALSTSGGSQLTASLVITLEHKNGDSTTVNYFPREGGDTEYKEDEDRAPSKQAAFIQRSIGSTSSRTGHSVINLHSYGDVESHLVGLEAQVKRRKVEAEKEPAAIGNPMGQTI